MSTQIYEDDGYHKIDLTQFYGGNVRGICMQITCELNEPIEFGYFGYVHLTPHEAKRIGKKLMQWGADNS